MKATLKTLSALFLAVGSLAAHAAPAILNTGLIQMGVADNAGLGALGRGLNGPTGDAITPGCLCEGWGASASGSTGYTYGASGTVGFNSALLTTTTASGTGLAASSVVMMANGLQVTHSYSYAAGGKLFKVAIELKNTTAGLLTDVRYARTLDWDVTPGFFTDNYTTVYGGTPTGPGGKVLHTSTDPFGVPDPLMLRSQDANTNVVDSRGDRGGFFIFGFGSLLAGASQSFDTFIGADSSVSGLLGALASVGVEAYSYTTGNTPGTDGFRFAPAYGYGFVGLGLAPSLGTVPEPGSLALVGLGLLGFVAARRKSA